MDRVFQTLLESMPELVGGFMPQSLVGSLDKGFTNYDFWFIVAGILFFVLAKKFLTKQSVSIIPEGTYVNAYESLLDYAKNALLVEIVGPTWKEHFPFIITLFLLVFANNIIGMIPGCKAGTGTPGGTFALATISFAYFNWVGVKKLGFAGYMKSFCHGLNGVMGLGIWIIEMFSTFLRLVTLAVRLFCNLFAGHLVMATFAMLSTLFAKEMIIAAQALQVSALQGFAGSIGFIIILLIIYFVEFIVAFVQAFVFAILSAVYIQIAEEEVVEAKKEQADVKREEKLAKQAFSDEGIAISTTVMDQKL